MQYAYYHVGAQLSAAITTNATTLINQGSGAIFAGAVVATAGSAWTLEIYNGNPTSGGVLLTTISSSKPGGLTSPLLACPQGLYVETSNITAGSLSVCYYA